MQPSASASSLSYNKLGELKGEHIVLVGNPGVGKSTILNCLAGRVLFKAGSILGRGKTEILQSEIVNGVKLSDTPGLDDAVRRDEAAQEISNVITKGGLMKLIFVITLEAGRFRPVDKLMMTRTLDAIEQSGIETKFKYSIIVNKCDRDVLRLLQDPDQKTGLEVLLGAGQTIQPTDIAYTTFFYDAHGAPNYLLTQNGPYVDFIKRLPKINIPENNHAQLQVIQWEKKVQDLQNQLAVMRTKIDELINEKKKKRFFMFKPRDPLGKAFQDASSSKKAKILN